MKRYLYLPIEVAVREMDSRLLTALFAVNSGMDVFIGQKWLMQQNIGALPSGAFLFKTMSPRDYNHMLEAENFGHRIFAIDEEMPGLGEGCDDFQWVMQQAAERCDAIFLPGAAHFDAMQKRFPNCSENIFATGNPRWDMLRPELRGLYAREVEALRKRYGRFVLVNTNIGFMNSSKGSPEKLFRSLTKYNRINMSSEKDRSWVAASKVFETANMEATISFTRKLASANRETIIVVRPHPTEKLSTYIEAFKGNPNVVVIFEGPVVPWILAADVLVHTACTTANEAFALGVPAVFINTGPSIIYDQFISQKVSLEAGGVDEAVQFVQEILNKSAVLKRTRTTKMKAVFDRFFASGEGKFAAERIVEIISNSKGGVLGTSNRYKSNKFRNWRFRTRFQKKIFPDVPAQILEDRIQEMAKQLKMPILPNVEKCGQAFYLITNEKDGKREFRLPPYRSWLGELF